MSAQLALNLRLKDAASFENFFPGRNAEALAHTRAAAEAAGRGEIAERILFLAGPEGSGKTHLLQAACRAAQERGATPIYVPLAEAVQLSTAILEDADAAALVCLDDVERIAGRNDWEQALFALCERLRAAGGVLVAAGAAHPNNLGLRLPDLATRLAWGPVYALQPLDDTEKLAAIRLRARNRGLEMSEEAARYILARHPRDLHTLFDLLDRIDRAALASQRRITIPFLRGLEGDLKG
ncbi:MAG: DnaA regulatory inactivator Hda [Candidatus Muproteobacteria bacterium RBG_16_65_34]|uniref:DnaA regulatory inactivator Hda n=1 Tax=Candidatus Muproteobacteria bacterium RBG_16_65_34 TaxID=1817760 RepID=A0A1F6TLW7_9PROT|nr:MAG: DnaA regulatory inactivator Hda [Candidatus Muproteobacteria bacterium RBG_16_65_34]